MIAGRPAYCSFELLTVPLNSIWEVTYNASRPIFGQITFTVHEQLEGPGNLLGKNHNECNVTLKHMYLAIVCGK